MNLVSDFKLKNKTVLVRCDFNLPLDERGEVEKVIHIATDITGRKRAEEAILEKNRELEIANRMKSELMSIVSHDIGNPLGIIQMTVEMMSMGVYGEPTPTMMEKLHSILNTAKRLNKFRLDTLDFSRMDLGKLELKRKKLDIGKIVQDVVEGMGPEVEGKGQTIRLHPGDEIILNIDHDQIFRVLENYISNAIRYSPEGSTIELGVEDREKEVVVWTRDFGRGIAPEELASVFLPFYRTGKKVGGSTGLGLSIVESLVSAHGGRCWAESEGEGKGSTFYFTLPKE